MKIELLFVIGQVLVGSYFVFHGWTGPHLYPFLFGIWLLIDVRLHLVAKKL